MIKAWLEYRYDEWGEDRFHGMILFANKATEDGEEAMEGDDDDNKCQVHAYTDLDQFQATCTRVASSDMAKSAKVILPPSGLAPYIKSHLAAKKVGAEIHWTELYSPFVNQHVFPYQKTAVERMIHEFHGRCILSADMGLGKTIMSLLVAYYYLVNLNRPGRDPSSILIVAPTSTFGAWQKAVEDWCNRLPVTVVAGMKTTIETEHRVVLTSYQTACKHPTILKRVWTTVIYDECHMLKNPEALRTKALIDVARKSHSAILLSGTPRLNCSSELYTQLCCVYPASQDVRPFLGTYVDFIKRYCNARQVRYGGGKPTWEMGRPQFDDELNMILMTKMIRLTHKMVQLENMPAKHRIVHNVVISDPAFHEEQKRLTAKYQRSDIGLMEKKAIVMEQWRLVGQAKFPAVSKWCLEWLTSNPGERLVVFAHSVDLLKRYRDFFVGSGYQVGLVDGSVPQVQRQEVIRQLSNPEQLEMDVGLLTYGTCALGITLCPGSWTCVFAECEFTPALLEQAEAKLHRVGAVRDVYCYWMIAKGTLDDMVMGKIQGKTNSTSLILDRTERRLVFESSSSSSSTIPAGGKRARVASSTYDDDGVGLWRSYGLTLEEAQNVRITRNPRETDKQYVQRCTVVLDDVNGEDGAARRIKTSKVTRPLGVKASASGSVLVILEPFFYSQT